MYMCNENDRNSAKILIDLGVLEIDESFIVYMQQLQRTLFLDIWRVISSHTVHKARRVYIVTLLKPAIVICLNVESCFYLEDNSLCVRG